MLTKVILNGPMGKQFGKVWDLAVDSPAHALKLIDANKPGVFNWIRANLPKYATYRVTVEYEDGRKEDMDNDSVAMHQKAKTIRFTPMTEGGGAVARVVIGAVLVALAFVPGFQGASTQLIAAGSAMILGGIVAMLAPKPKVDKKEEGKSSYYFDGPSSTTGQGNPVQLTYGRCLVGGHTISAAVTVDQLL